MIRFFCRSYLAHRWMIRAKIFHPSLDRLSELHEALDDRAANVAKSSEEFSRILQNLRIGGVWKWTGPHRLSRLDQLLSDTAASLGWKSVRMLDLGASDGSTTFDTIRHMQRSGGIPVNATILDLQIRLLSLRWRAGKLYCTASGHPLLVKWGRCGLCLEPMEGLEGLLFNRLSASIAKKVEFDLQPFQLAQAHTISLLNPVVARCPLIHAHEGDLFEAVPEWFDHFDVVRASNVLNFSYFPAGRIMEAVGLAHRYLKDGGLLLVSRNIIGRHNETETGGLWRKDGPHFVLQSRLSELPEISGLIEVFKPT